MHIHTEVTTSHADVEMKQSNTDTDRKNNWTHVERTGRHRHMKRTQPSTRTHTHDEGTARHRHTDVEQPDAQTGKSQIRKQEQRTAGHVDAGRGQPDTNVSIWGMEHSTEPRTAGEGTTGRVCAHTEREQPDRRTR